MFALCSRYVRAMFARDRNGRRVQSSRKGKQCAAYYWGMQLQIARRIGRRVQRSQKGQQCAAYYWGMQLQIPRRIGRRVQRSRNVRHIIRECKCRLLDALAREFTGRGMCGVLLGNATADCQTHWQESSEVAERTAMCGILLGNATADCWTPYNGELKGGQVKRK